ncbi:MAG TPA: glycogen debranching protein GlgX [Ktedonobacterales bacterium]
MARTIWPGKPYPLGATYNGKGVNFALYTEAGKRVELCLFERPGPGATCEKVTLPEVTAHVHHGFLPGMAPGQLYGYRVYGEYKPEEGLRFNPSKLLIDPYAKALCGTVDWKAPVFGYKLGDEAEDLSYDDRDDAYGVPKGVVIDQSDPGFDWEGDELLRTPLNDTIIYEAHVKGFTKRHPKIPEKQRGTYAGLASPPAIKYLRDLGITAIELLPVHAFLDDGVLLDRGLRNYWGYNTINFFAPEARYSSSGDRGGQVREFKEMVKALHRAGIEVILDVVYNHTAEGNHLGPTLSLRGIDNTTYYRLVPEDPRYYFDYTGTGNSPNMRHPQQIMLIMDSLRYWVQQMHVDGFRFDLAATLARGLQDVDRLSAFFDVIHQDPTLSTVKLIAEPWDVGEGGYQVGNFPVLWSEWNGKYRDDVRRYWKGDDGVISELGFRLTGSSDLYQDDGRHPSASINFVTAHDGFTLADLVSYEEKHNEANGEENRDGANDNNSWNGGVEGPTEDEEILARREQQKRNFLATLMVSQGVPMICGGDEISRTQHGNNNAYCQDNELGWHDWTLSDRQQALLHFTRQVIKMRREHPVLHRRRFFRGRRIRGSEVKDIAWLRADGREMADDEWNTGWVRTVGMRLGGDAIPSLDEEGNVIEDETLLVLLNAHWEPVPFVLPQRPEGGHWVLLVDTAESAQQTVGGEQDGQAGQARRRAGQTAHTTHTYAPGGEYRMSERSLVVLRHVD